MRTLLDSKQFAFGNIDRYLLVFTHTTISFTQTKSIGKEYLRWYYDQNIAFPSLFIFWEVEFLSTYHAKFYLKIRTGSYFDFVSWVWPIQICLLDSKMTERITNELAPVNQIGSDVIFASQQNIVANFPIRLDCRIPSHKMANLKHCYRSAVVVL